jgi:hypothetical protein
MHTKSAVREDGITAIVKVPDIGDRVSNPGIGSATIVESTYDRDGRQVYVLVDDHTQKAGVVYDELFVLNVLEITENKKEVK